VEGEKGLEAGARLVGDVEPAFATFRPGNDLVLISLEHHDKSLRRAVRGQPIEVLGSVARCPGDKTLESSLEIS